MPKASKYVSPKNGPLGEEIRESLADLVTRITTKRLASNKVDAANLGIFLTAVQADLTAFASFVPSVTAVTVSTNNIIDDSEGVSPAPVVATLSAGIKAGDFVRVVVKKSSGDILTTTNGAALTAGATTATVNIPTGAGMVLGNYVAFVYVVNASGNDVASRTQAFTRSV